MSKPPKWVWVALAAMLAAGLFVVARGMSDDTDAADDVCMDAIYGYTDYLRRATATMRHGVQQTDPEEVQDVMWDLGYLLEQNHDREDQAVQVCYSAGDYSAGVELREASYSIDETYVKIVISCVLDGIYDCGALMPAKKAACEANPEMTFLLDVQNVERWLPAPKNRTGCRNLAREDAMMAELIEKIQNEGY